MRSHALVFVPLVLIASLLQTSVASARPAQSTCSAEHVSFTTVATGDGSVESVAVGTDRPRPPAASERLYVRITFSEAVVPHLVYLDTDDERLTGMWSYQSHVSGSGWDRLVDVWGTLYAHAADRPNAWSWAPLDDPGYRRTASGNVVDLCIPVDALGAVADRVRVAVQAADGWVPEVFLPGAAYPQEHLRPAPPKPTTPSRLAIHYGAHPWTVRGCTTVDCAVDVYGNFSHVVLGGGLETDEHDGHEGTVALIRGLRQAHPKTEVWGYLSLVGTADRAWSVPEILSHAAAWKATGATGILLDEADLCEPAWGEECRRDASGTRVPITRERQIAVVEGIHALGLDVFANAYSPYDVLADAGGVPSPLGRGDMYLLENPTVVAGWVRTGLDAAVSDAKFTMAHRFRARLGVGMAAVDTLGGWVSDDADETATYELAWTNASEARLDSYGFTNAAYSAPAELAGNLAILDPPG